MYVFGIELVLVFNFLRFLSNGDSIMPRYFREIKIIAHIKSMERSLLINNLGLSGDNL